MLYNTVLINSLTSKCSPAYFLLACSYYRSSLLLPETKSDLTSTPILENISLYNKPLTLEQMMNILFKHILFSHRPLPSSIISVQPRTPHHMPRSVLGAVQTERDGSFCRALILLTITVNSEFLSCFHSGVSV